MGGCQCSPGGWGDADMAPLWVISSLTTQGQSWVSVPGKEPCHLRLASSLPLPPPPSPLPHPASWDLGGRALRLLLYSGRGPGQWPVGLKPGGGSAEGHPHSLALALFCLVGALRTWVFFRLSACGAERNRAVTLRAPSAPRAPCGAAALLL